MTYVSLANFHANMEVAAAHSARHRRLLEGGRVEHGGPAGLRTVERRDSRMLCVLHKSAPRMTSSDWLNRANQRANSC